MGNKVTLNPTIPIIREEQWEQIQAVQIQHPQFGQFRTLRNEYTGQLIDEYRVDCVDEDDYQTYLESFTWRLKEDDIVKTMYLKQAHRQEFCSKTYIVKVYIQHIGTRLSDITDIPFPQNLYVCMCALRGYQTLYDYLQYFRVQQNQICVDSEGKVRVWINSDLSKNYPNINEETQGADQTSMVQQIIQLISENTDQDSQPIPLKEYFEGNSDRPVGFEEAKSMINEYARQHNVVIPQCFESILEIYQKQEEYSNRDGVEYKNNDSRYVGKLSKASNQPESSRFNHNNINQNSNANKVLSSFQPQQSQNNLSHNQQPFHPISSVRTQGQQKQSSALRHTFRDEAPNEHNAEFKQQKQSPINSSNIQIGANFFKPMSIDINQYRIYQPYQQEIRVPPQYIPYGYPQQYSHFYPPQYYATQLRPQFIANQPTINVLPPPSHIITQNTSPPKPYSPSPFSKASIDKPQSPIVPMMNIQTNNSRHINQNSIKVQTRNNESYLKEVINEDSSKKLLPNKKSQFRKINQVEKNHNNNSHEQDRHVQIEGEKAYYYTIDTEEQLDPQIAADLRKLYPIE